MQLNVGICRDAMAQYLSLVNSYFEVLMSDFQNKNPKLVKARIKAERKKASRRERGTALVVCEGKCTEPFYVQGLLKHLEISVASVEII
jgi:hypothetical protein